MGGEETGRVGSVVGIQDAMFEAQLGEAGKKKDIELLRIIDHEIGT